MTRGDNPQHKLTKEKQRVKDSDLSDSDTKAVLDFIRAKHPEMGSESKTLGYGTLEAYGRALRLVEKESDCDLLEHTNDSLDSVFTSLLADLSNQTVRQRQAACRTFYNYTEGHPVIPEKIPLVSQGDTSVDERDMFTREEVHEMREACSNTRDRCLIELLLYTGQRIRAIQTLRVKDIDLENNVYYLNTQEEGLKGADKSGKKRPLLGATKAVREWLNHHPTGEPEDYLLTALPSATNTTTNKGDYISLPAIRYRLDKIGEEAGIDKPTNAHNFRHYFVTVAHREYEIDPSTIKHLIGHKPDSTIMESTYSHLTDEDHIQEARKSAKGVGQEPQKDKGSLTPEVCPTCDENLPPAAKACPGCGMVFTPDAKQTQEQIQEDMYEAKGEAEGEEEEALDTLKGLIKDNPELINELTD